jgi:hypothetical protein
MRGVPGNGGKSEGSDYSGFWVKAPNTNSEIGTTLSRARARSRASFADAKNGTAVSLTSESVEEQAASRRPDARPSPAYHFGHAMRRCHILPGHSSGRST